MVITRQEWDVENKSNYKYYIFAKQTITYLMNASNYTLQPAIAVFTHDIAYSKESII
jgi:hypothetical protein